MKISRVLATPGLNGFYSDDKAAIRRGAKMDGFVYEGVPVTPGFTRVRQPGESASIVLMLDDGSHAFGDALTVQYTGAGGREALLGGAQMARIVMEVVAPALEGRALGRFRELSVEVENLRFEGAKVPASIAYGASQAVLDAVATARRLTPAEVIAEEYGLPIPTEPVRINAQSGDDRYANVDKMILKKAGFMPHGLFNNAREKIGPDGAAFLAYAQWVRDRILAIGAKDYRPVLRFDVYGTLGEALGDDPQRIVDYLARVRAVTEPYDLFIEMPVDMGDAQRQFEVMRAIRRGLAQRRLAVGLIIDEYANTLEEVKAWADSDACDMIQVKTPDLGGLHNTVEAALYAKRAGKLVYLGGSCTDTDQSARLCTNIALAVQPFACSGRPGMGVDEALMIVGNEMNRVLAICKARRS